jgi:hypothetical protein
MMWISWERHRRTLELCDYLDIKPTIYDNDFPFWFRYIYNSIKSWISVHAAKPEVLFVQNPSIILTFLACMLKFFYNYKLIVDAHNIAIIQENKHKYICSIYRFLQRKSDLTIVTNKALADLVVKNGGKPFILPDRIPKYPVVERSILGGKFNIAYICSYKSDEPIRDVVNAARKFDKNVYFYITGNINNCPQDIKSNLPENIILTGFLTENDYWKLIISVDLIIDLTFRENCLVCGAYEAVAAEKPMVLSNTKTLKGHFDKGAVFTDNEEVSIKNTISFAMLNYNRLNSEVKVLKKELIRKWEVDGNNLKNTIATY